MVHTLMFEHQMDDVFLCYHQSYFTNTVFETVGGIQVSAEGQAYLCCMYLTPLIEY